MKEGWKRIVSVGVPLGIGSQWIRETRILGAGTGNHHRSAPHSIATHQCDPKAAAFRLRTAVTSCALQSRYPLAARCGLAKPNSNPAAYCLPCMLPSLVGRKVAHKAKRVQHHNVARGTSATMVFRTRPLRACSRSSKPLGGGERDTTGRMRKKPTGATSAGNNLRRFCRC